MPAAIATSSCSFIFIEMFPNFTLSPCRNKQQSDYCDSENRQICYLKSKKKEKHTLKQSRKISICEYDHTML
ncbi:hypothetical protein PSSHI_05350 [Photobacterium sp. R1]